MGVAVLNPQDCLKNPLSSRQSLMSRPRRLDKANRSQSNRRKRSPNPSPPSRANVTKPKPKPPLPKNLVTGQVKILKRGEKPLQPSNIDDMRLEEAPRAAEVDKSDHPRPLGSIRPLDRNPVSVPIQIRLSGSNTINGFYAGSAFITSPPPSSLPLPAFVTKKTVGINKNDEATSNLYRILGLN
uniref:Uncharacterized protein MANES_09G184700 n=1 Tax=Rhizophora mucronata TaxID=61149 RepID=A0A2P2MHB5_RHIMU